MTRSIILALALVLALGGSAWAVETEPASGPDITEVPQGCVSYDGGPLLTVTGCFGRAAGNWTADLDVGHRFVFRLSGEESGVPYGVTAFTGANIDGHWIDDDFRLGVLGAFLEMRFEFSLPLQSTIRDGLEDAEGEDVQVSLSDQLGVLPDELRLSGVGRGECEVGGCEFSVAVKTEVVW